MKLFHFYVFHFWKRKRKEVLAVIFCFSKEKLCRESFWSKQPFGKERRKNKNSSFCHSFVFSTYHFGMEIFFVFFFQPTMETSFPAFSFFDLEKEKKFLFLLLFFEREAVSNKLFEQKNERKKMLEREKMKKKRNENENKNKMKKGERRTEGRVQSISFLFVFISLSLFHFALDTLKNFSSRRQSKQKPLQLYLYSLIFILKRNEKEEFSGASAFWKLQQKRFGMEFVSWVAMVLLYVVCLSTLMFVTSHRLITKSSEKKVSRFFCFYLGLWPEEWGALVVGQCHVFPETVGGEGWVVVGQCCFLMFLWHTMTCSFYFSSFDFDVSFAHTFFLTSKWKAVQEKLFIQNSLRKRKKKRERSWQGKEFFESFYLLLFWTQLPHPKKRNQTSGEGKEEKFWKLFLFPSFELCLFFQFFQNFTLLF